MEYWAFSPQQLTLLKFVGGLIAMVGTICVLVSFAGLFRSIKPSWLGWMNIMPLLIFLPWPFTERGRRRYYFFFLISLVLSFLGWKAIFFAEEYRMPLEERFWHKVQVGRPDHK